MFQVYLPVVSMGDDLKSALARRDILFGTATDYRALDNSVHVDALLENFNQITVESSLKMRATQPFESTFTFLNSDKTYNFGVNKGLPVVGHTLVWHLSVPDWVGKYAGNTYELQRVIREHIAAVMTRYPRINTWDVVNEPINLGTAAVIPFAQAAFDYVEYAFDVARLLFPSKKFYLNTGFVGSDAFIDALKTMVMKAQPDGVGIQNHLWYEHANWQYFTKLAEFVDWLGARGITYSISEMDVRVPLPPTEQQITSQEIVYEKTATLIRNHGICTRLTMWGVSDKESWIPFYFPGWGDATLLDIKYKRKPAYNRMYQIVK